MSSSIKSTEPLHKRLRGLVSVNNFPVVSPVLWLPRKDRGLPRPRFQRVSGPQVRPGAGAFGLMRRLRGARVTSGVPRLAPRANEEIVWGAGNLGRPSPGASG
jgi:hypothetical protein